MTIISLSKAQLFASLCLNPESIMLSTANIENTKPFWELIPSKWMFLLHPLPKNQPFQTNEAKKGDLRSGTHHKVVFSHILPLRGSAEQPPGLCWKRKGSAPNWRKRSGRRRRREERFSLIEFNRIRRWEGGSLQDMKVWWSMMRRGDEFTVGKEIRSLYLKQRHLPLLSKRKRERCSWTVVPLAVKLGPWERKIKQIGYLTEPVWLRGYLRSGGMN